MSFQVGNLHAEPKPGCMEKENELAPVPAHGRTPISPWSCSCQHHPGIPGSLPVLCGVLLSARRLYFSSSSPSLMLLMEAEAALGEDGGEVLLGSHEKVGDGEREGDRLRVGLLTGLCFGDKAWSIRLLLSWNICF